MSSARVVITVAFVLATGFIFALVARHHGTAVAMLGASLFATNPFVVNLSRWVLSEAPTLALVAAAALFADRFCGSQRRRDLVAFVLAATASAYSKQLAVFVFPAFLLYAIACLGWRRLLERDTVVAALALGLLVAPVVPLTLAWSPHNVGLIADETFADVRSLGAGIRTTYSPLVLGLAAIGLATCLLRRDRLAWLLVPWAAGGFVVVVFFTQDLEPARYAVYSAPAVLMLAALSATGSNHRSISLGLIACLSAAIVHQGVVSARAPLPGSGGYEQAARFVVEHPVGATVLYSAEVDTGLFVFFVRKHDEARQRVVLRADKLLTTSLMREVSVEERIVSREEIYAILRQLGVGYVVIEDRPTSSRALNWLREETRTERFVERLRVPVVSDSPRLRDTSLAVYEFLEKTAPAADAVVDMKLPLVGSEVSVRLGDLLSRKYLR